MLKRIIKTEAEIQIPLTPNFLRVGEAVLPIKEFSEREIRAVAKEWTKELLSKRLGATLRR